MESTDKHKISVAIFVLIGAGLIFISIMLLGGDRYVFKSYYQLQAKFPQVQGLFEGSVVSLAGLTVGNVKKIELDEKDQSIILVMAVDEKFRKRITQGSIASVQTQGALGDKYIYIKPGPIGAAILSENSVLESEPESDLIELIKKRGPDFTHFMDVAKQLNILLTNINETGHLNKTLANVSGASEEFKKLMSETRALVSDVRGGKPDEGLKSSVAHLSSVMKKIDQGQGTLGALVNDPALHNKILSFVGDSPRNKYLKPLLRESIQAQDK